MTKKKRDKDLEYYSPKARDITIRVRDIFDKCEGDNPNWLLGLLIEEMYNHDLIDEFQQELFRREIGL